MQKNKVRVAIIAGGYSGEYEVSLESARAIKKHLNPSRYHSELVIISKKDWYVLRSDNNQLIIDKSDFSFSEHGRKVTFDVVFNACHGSPGEDGRMQGYFDLIGIPQTSSGMFASSLTFNKFYSNNFARSFGFSVANQLLLKKDAKLSDLKADQMGYPLFVKPNKGGSSVGVSKVYQAEHLEAAVQMAFHEDDEVVLESFLEGREFSCSVFKTKNKTLVFPITEIIPENDFFDYEAKYHGKALEITPADIEEDVSIEMKAMSVELYELFCCSGFVRIDFILHGQQLYFLEINTIPGLGEASILPQQAEDYGMPLSQLFEEVLLDTLARKA